MFTKKKVKQVIEEMKVTGETWGIENIDDFDLVYCDWAITAWSELITRLWLDIVIDDNYTNWIHVWFSLRICGKDGNKETFNRVIDSDFGFTVGENEDEQVLADITDLVNGRQEQYEDIKRRFEID